MKGIFSFATVVPLIIFLLRSANCVGQESPSISTNSFVNWETAPVHPVALSPDGNTLAVCNLPDNRLELIDLRPNTPAPPVSVSVGLDPVSVRFINNSEAWVVNKLSDSVSVVDVPTHRVRATLDTRQMPADVAFAGTPRRAFVTCGSDNVVLVFDPVTLQKTNVISIDGDRPRSMAVSPDGAKLYVAIFESGNASTILGPRFGLLSVTPPLSATEAPTGPYHGTNTPPNRGTGLYPPLNPNLPDGTPLPPAELIVKKDARGRWIDDNGGDWSDFVSGTNATLSGRQPGWDLSDHDVAVIDAQSYAVTYISGLMNLCMDLAVNPQSGVVTVVGTDAINQVRFEPILNGVFVRVEVALADPMGTNTVVKDLNPHLDYTTNLVAEALRNASVGDPRGVLWDADGARAFVTGMGSSNLIVLDANGNRLEPKAGIVLGSGPTGLALDPTKHQLYVLNRFDATVSLVDTLSLKTNGLIRLFDPTPNAVKLGRRHFYDTHKTSGLGQVSCASCHPDARMDRLAWDLGNPAGDAISDSPPNRNYLSAFSLPPNPAKNYHPMKGPMVTQTLQDIIGHEPFHWRGDRDGIEQFNPTFTNLQAAVAALTTNEMREFKDFLATVNFPPNRRRNLDNSLSTNVPLDGEVALGRGVLPAGSPLGPGNAVAGIQNFNIKSACNFCHTLPTGLGTDTDTTIFPRALIPLGPNGEHHINLVNSPRERNLPFKVSQLRNLDEKRGADFSHPNGRAGFGFFHDGRVDSLTRFLQDGFSITDDGDTANLIALLLSLPASVNTLEPSPANQQVPAGVGRQITISAPDADPLITTMIGLASSPTNGVDLVVHGFKESLPRGWFFDRTSARFQSDRLSETLAPSDLLQLAGPGRELTYTITPAGSGLRIGVDRDGDGYFDRDELDLGSSPSYTRSVPVINELSITLNNLKPTLQWRAAAGHTYRAQWKGSLADATWNDVTPDITASSAVATVTDATLKTGGTRYYRVRLVQ